MISDKIKQYKQYIAIFGITLLLVQFVRVFLIESYTVSSSQMELTLYKGDRVLVSKTAYGIRMPITVLSIPFTFDSFWGIRSYSDLILLNYRRLFKNEVNRNDVVVFNNPLETEKPLDKRSLFLSRCVAIPGDTIKVKGNNLFINGKKYIPAPDFLMTFHHEIKDRGRVDSVMNLFKIPVRRLSSDSLYEYVYLNRYEAFILNQKLPQLSSFESDTIAGAYDFVVPAKGSLITLTKKNIILYGDVILQEQNMHDSLKIRSDKISEDEMSRRTYKFRDDYYWFISDNPDKGNDSRSLGFISERCLVGKAFFVWYGSGRGDEKSSRTFTVVN